MKYFILILLCYTSFNSFGQSSNLNCGAFKFGDFINDDPKDSIYVYRDYGTWYEMHVREGYRIIFSVIWEDDCNFLLVFNDCSANDSSIRNYYKHDTLHYKAIDIDTHATTAAFEVKDKHYAFKTYQSLSMGKGLDVWEYMLTRDNKLKADSSFNHGPMSMFPDSVRRNKKEMKKILQTGLMNVPEIEQVEYVLSLLKNEDVTPVFTIAAPEFKGIVPENTLKDYNFYLQNVFGKLKSYQVSSSPVNIDLSKIYGDFPSALMNNKKTYTFDAAFEKVKGPVKISVTLELDSIYKIVSFNVEVKKNTAVPFISSMTDDFWKLLNKGDYKKIYSNSSELLKSRGSLSQIKNILSLIKSYGEIADYTLYFQTFEVEENRGIVGAEYKNNKNSIVTLSYVLENGTYKLGGINYNQK